MYRRDPLTSLTWQEASRRIGLAILPNAAGA
jgi:hypothetical protein